MHTITMMLDGTWVVHFAGDIEHHNIATTKKACDAAALASFLNGGAALTDAVWKEISFIKAK